MSTEIQKLDEERIIAASEEYLYSLLLYVQNENITRIFASKCPSRTGGTDSRFAFYMEFRKDEDSGEKYLTWHKINPYFLSTSEIQKKLDDSTDLVELGQKHFNQIVHLWGQKLQVQLDEHPEDTTLHQTAMLQLDYPDVEPLIKKSVDITHEVVHSIQGVVENDWGNDVKKVFDILTYVYMPQISFRLEQFLRLKASRIHIHIGRRTAEEVFEFIESWRNGQVRDNFEFCVWNIQCSRFDVKTFASLLNDNYGQSEPIEVKQDNGRVGRVYYNDNEVKFICDELEIEVVDAPDDSEVVDAPDDSDDVRIRKPKSKLRRLFHKLVHKARTFWISLFFAKYKRFGKNRF